MVNAGCIRLRARAGKVSENPERVLALSYSPHAGAARALAALLSLDDRLAETVRTTREPMLGQIRLKWWYDALTALDDAPPPAEPLLQMLASDALPCGMSGARIAAIAEAWGGLFAKEMDDDALDTVAGRGRALFELAGVAAGALDTDPIGQAGEGWALADLAHGLSDAGEATRARDRARTALENACSARWSRNARALGAMAHLARLDLSGSRPGSPRRVGRLLWHRVTGR